MAQVRCYGSSITNGIPFVAIVADEANPADHTAVGGSDADVMVKNRWNRFTKKGMPPTLETLAMTLSGSHVGVSPWEPVGEDRADAVAATQQVLAAGQPLPGAFIVPAAP